MSVSDDVLRVLQERGPMALQQLFEATGHKKKTLQSKLYELRQAGKVARNRDGVYEALPGATLEEDGDPDILPPAVQDRPGPQSKETKDTPGPQAQANPLRQPLSGDQEKFRALLQDCDVRKALDTITETFFAGDPENLVSVLDDARAYVSPLQRRLIVRYWARYIKRDLPPLLEERLNRRWAAWSFTRAWYAPVVAGPGAGDQYPGQGPEVAHQLPGRRPAIGVPTRRDRRQVRRGKALPSPSGSARF